MTDETIDNVTKRQAATRRRGLWEVALHESGHIASRAILQQLLSSARIWPGGGETIGWVDAKSESYGTTLAAGDAAGSLSWALEPPPEADDIVVETLEVIEADKASEVAAEKADAPSDAKLLATWCIRRGPAIPPHWAREHERACTSARHFVRRYIGIITRIAEYLYAYRELEENDLAAMLPATLRDSLRFPDRPDTTAGDDRQKEQRDDHSTDEAGTKQDTGPSTGTATADSRPTDDSRLTRTS